MRASIGGAGGKDGAVNGGAGVAVIPVYPAGNTGAGGMGGEACGVTGPRDGSYGLGGVSGAGPGRAPPRLVDPMINITPSTNISTGATHRPSVTPDFFGSINAHSP